MTACPAISVIIPMYNAEKYIGECLESLLLQTFQDFEVIVVDDCSTDKSVEIVQSYIPKFDGRLKLTKTEKNSGGGGYVPRNIGLILSRGKYVFFLDADDFILLSGLETLYEAAEKFDADVTYISAHYSLDRPNEVKILAEKNLEDKPIFIADDTDKIVREYLSNKWFSHAPWSVFVKRDFLIENRILFPENVYGSGDIIWNLHIRCLSKRFLIIPNPVYFRRRYDPEAVTKKRRPPAEQIYHSGRALALWLKALSELSNKLDFLKKNSDCVYDLFKMEVGWILNSLREYRKQLNDRKIYEILYRELAKENNSTDWMMPFFFAFINEERKFNEINSLEQLQRYFTARLDIQLIETDAGDFQIVSVSDDTAKLEKPDWFQKDAIGYVIQSYAGKMEIVAKATSSGKCILKLKGMDVRDPADRTKRIPYWIDYTKLLVNEQVIFDTLTPAWHDKPYQYNMNVTAGDEIKIQVEWITHAQFTKTISNVSDNSFTCPAVSVIIPLYNYEKYIGECLENLLAQTLKNFEVIVVDDCSTDKSVEIVQSYVPKFGGRLRLVKMKKNSGNAAEPRNRGFSFSRGEYIYFLDADDVITPTALEEMYMLAKDYAADVVYCEKYFMSKGIGQAFKENVYPADSKIQQPPFVDKPTLETNDLSERVDKWLKKNYWMSVSLRLTKRDLLIENNITFSPIRSEDDIWSLEVLFCAKRFLRIPNICFIRRMHDSGISFGEYTTSEYIQRWMELVILALKDLDNFLGETKFFKENPNLRHVIIKNFVSRKLSTIYGKTKDLDSFELYNIFLETFGKHLGEQDILVSALLACMNEDKKNLQNAKQRIEKLQDEINRLTGKE